MSENNNNNSVGKGGEDSDNKERINNNYKKLVTDINELEKDFKALTDTELRIKTFELQNEYLHQYRHFYML